MRLGQRGFVLLVTLLLIIAAFGKVIRAREAQGDGRSEFVRVVVVGATGDLAAKYLWAACFRLALKTHLTQNRRVLFVAAARESEDAGNQWKTDFFSSEWVRNVCGDSSSVDANECRVFYTNEFVPNIQYATLGTSDDYVQLSTMLKGDDIDLEMAGLSEFGRLVYLAIPPRAFLSASQLLSTHLRPTNPSAFFRVVIEKPFGNDLDSAKQLATGLRKVLRDEEMLLMDHYAAKPGVRVIEPFILGNPRTLARVWNGNFINHIEITMTETETCEHRLDYFDRNGIIRDVMANHLLLLLGAIVSPSFQHCEGARGDYTTLCTSKFAEFLDSVIPEGDTKVGQYDNYGAGSLHSNASTNSRSSTATAALTRLRSTIDPWSGTLITISAAKATNVRKVDIRVTFKQDPVVHDNGTPCSIQFVVQEGPKSAGERIVVRCSSLGELKVPSSWSLAEAATYVREREQPLRWGLGNPISAYDTLLDDAAHGRSDRFMNVDEVLASWGLWSPIVAAAESYSHSAIVRYAVGATSWLGQHDPSSQTCQFSDGSTCSIPR